MPVFVIIGAFIGAGFASGEEMYLFFYRFGKNGIWGLLISSLLMGIIIYKTCSIVLKKDIKSYQMFLEETLKNKKLAKIKNIFITIFLLSIFYIMVSGFGAYFSQEFGKSPILGAILLAGSCFIVLLNNIKGVTKVSSIVVPLLIICTIIISIINIRQMNFNNTFNLLIENSEISLWWLLQSFLYCSYNMVAMIPVLVNLRKYIKNKEQIIGISIISSLIIFILGISIFLLLTNIQIDLNTLEMPAVYAISNYFPQFRVIYGIVILLAIFTTAISDGNSFLQNVVKNKKYYPHIAGIMCISSIIISNFGFSNLVEFVFPLFGYFGIIQIINILIS